MNSDLANRILKDLWPHPVCKGHPGEKENSAGCTHFPLPVTERDFDGGLTGRYMDGSRAWFLPERGAGVTDYHCTWMVLHTLSFNGPPILTAQEKRAFGEMLMYVSGQFDCKVCRNNFVHIIEQYGLPSGSLRETYAQWLWQAHNLANEHTYATHSPDNQEILLSNRTLTAADRRWDMWANPVYMHPWYMSLEDAEALWTF